MHVLVAMIPTAVPVNANLGRVKFQASVGQRLGRDKGWSWRGPVFTSANAAERRASEMADSLMIDRISVRDL